MRENSKFGGSTPSKYGNTANLRGADPIKARRDWSGLKGPEARPRPQTEAKTEAEAEKTEETETKPTKPVAIKRNKFVVSSEVAQVEPLSQSQLEELLGEPEVSDNPVTPPPSPSIEEDGDQQTFPL
jgi:hypothetical protein